MQSIRTAALTVALIAIGAAFAANASAEAPEFGRCVATAGGKYATSACTTEVAGKTNFEWLPGTVAHGFATKLKEGIPTLASVGGSIMTCKGESGSGEYTGPKTVGGLVVTFTGCEFTGIKCNSAGGVEGEIITSSLEGELGVEAVGTNPPFNDKLALEWHAPAGSNFAEFTCAGLAVIWRGSILHPVTTNKMLLSDTTSFTASKAEQKPDRFAGGFEDEHTLTQNTSGGRFEEYGWTMTLLTTNEEKVEANSVN